MSVITDIRNFCRSYLHAGISEANLENSHRASLVNGICFASTIALALLVVVGVYRQSWVEVTADIVYLTIFQIPVWLNRKARIVGSRRLLILVALFTVT
jgi:hypothetical protein